MKKFRKRLKTYYYNMWTYDFNTRGYKQIQLWFNVDCIAGNDVVFLPDGRYKQIIRSRKQRR